MTPKQEATIAEVRKLLKGDFDSWVLAYKITDENLQSKVNSDWHGHMSDIVGLTSITHSRLLEMMSLKRNKR